MDFNTEILSHNGHVFSATSFCALNIMRAGELLLLLFLLILLLFIVTLRIYFFLIFHFHICPHIGMHITYYFLWFFLRKSPYREEYLKIYNFEFSYNDVVKRFMYFEL